MKYLLILLFPLTCLAAPTYGPLVEGTFNCKNEDYEDVTLTVFHHPAVKNKILIKWDVYSFTLHHIQSISGARRYEGSKSKVVYIQIPTHSVVLNDHSEQPLLLDCIKEER